MKNIIIVGGGFSGLVTAIKLREKGYPVTLLEKNTHPGGKMGELRRKGFRFDAGPSLFTMPTWLDQLFESCGENPRDYYSYAPLDPVCRYFFADGLELDGRADPMAFRHDLEEVLGEDGEKVGKFQKECKELFLHFSGPFLFYSPHKLSNYFRNKEFLRSYKYLPSLKAFTSLHKYHESFFENSRTVQLFDRNATYNGSDPYRAPAVLSMISYMEHEVGAFYPQGGMYQLVRSLEKLAYKMGVHLHYESPVKKVTVNGREAVGVVTNEGLLYKGETIILATDIRYAYKYLLPKKYYPKRLFQKEESTSALIFYWGVKGITSSLQLHNVLFSEEYKAEFTALFEDHQLPSDPTIYIYISSKMEPKDAPEGHENWFVMVNAPVMNGQDWKEKIAAVREKIITRIENQLKVSLRENIVMEKVQSPETLWQKTHSWNGALYGSSSNSPWAAFRRHANFSRRISNLFFVGGSVHPGGGIPLCLASAKIVAEMVDGGP